MEWVDSIPIPWTIFWLAIQPVFHSIPTMDSMEFPMNLYDGILWKETIQCVVKNGVAVKNQTANFMICHVCKPENILTAAPYNHYKTID
jgi:hypothetical protein